MFCIVFLTACTGNNIIEESVQDSLDSGLVLATPGNYDSIDTAILASKNLEENTLTFINQETKKRYTLYYDGATTYYNKYNESIALSQVEVGDIVDISFMKEQKRLNSLNKSSDCFIYSEIINHEIRVSEQMIAVGSDIYSLDADVFVSSNGEEIDIDEIHACDEITIEGFERNVESIRVERGHGYLSLLNDEYFIDGWIEVGQSTIQKITEGMLITVPEGDYLVKISSGSSGGEKEVTIERDKEVKLDISDLEIAETKMGGIIFTLSPTDALLYIDGELVDISEIVELEYGIHQMVVSKDGYVTVTQYLKVGTTLASIQVTLDPEETTEDTEETNTNNTTDSTTAETSTTEVVTTTTGGSDDGTVTTTYTVSVESPEEVEVYVDGTYIGISPVSFLKVSGEHIVTLRKTGYQTRNYTLNVDTEEKSVTYSFSELLPLE